MKAHNSTPAEGLPVGTVSRRRVAAGAAWSVPVILFAAAAPAAAASALAVIAATVTAVKNASGQFGVKQVSFELTLTNSGNAAATVVVLSVSSSANTGSTSGLPSTVTVPAGGSVLVTFGFTYSGNAGTATYTILYTVGGGPTHVITATA